MTKAERELIYDYKECFTATTAGARVLEDMRRSIGERPSYQPGDPYQTAYHEGERSLYLKICLLIAQADALPPEEDEDDEATEA